VVLADPAGGLRRAPEGGFDALLQPLGMIEGVEEGSDREQRNETPSDEQDRNGHDEQELDHWE
jgi:hypothetical protein